MKPVGPLLGLVLALAGCTAFEPQSSQPDPSALSRPMAASDIDWARQNGTNTVNAVAATETAGTRHTCNGQSANLIPDSPYARARMTAIFGSAAGGMRAASAGPVKFEHDDPLYVSSLRTTRCTPAGTFSFQRVPDGTWYVTTSVKWNGPSGVEGGSMMRRVELTGGKTVKVTLP